MQVTVDGNDLDNGTTRIIWDEITDTVSPDGERIVMVGFSIEGASAAALATLYGTTVSTFVKRDATVTIDLGGSTLISIAPNDGTHLATQTGIMPNPNHRDTSLTVFRTFVIQAEVSVEGPDAGLSPSTGLESFQLTTIYPPGRNETIVASGTFVATTGVTAAANYAAARGGILTDKLTTSADGSRDATSGMVLVSETTSDVDGNNSRLEFSLEAEWRKFALSNSANARNEAINIGMTRPERWNSGGGTRPVILSASGSVFFDRDVVTNLYAEWTNLRADIVAEVSAFTGVGDFKTMAPDDVSFDATQGLIQFSLIWQGQNTDTLEFESSRTIQDRVIEAEAVDGDGFTHIQTSPDSPQRTHTVTIRRVGLGYQAIRPDDFKPRPTISGRKVFYLGQSINEAESIREFGDNVVEQIVTLRYVERKVRSLEPQPGPVITPSGF